MTRSPCQRNQINLSEHSKEPWRINGYTGASLHPSILVEPSDGNGSIALIVCNANPRANAARIVACVNFCAGLSDFRLTQDSVQTLELKMDGYKVAYDLISDEIAALKSRAEQAEQALENCKFNSECMKVGIQAGNEARDRDWQDKLNLSEQKLAMAMKAQEWIENWGPEARMYWQIPLGAALELREILNEKEGMLND